MTRGPVEGPHSVLLVTPSFGFDGGVASHVTSSAVALSDAGFEVTVVAARDENRPRRGVVFHELAELDLDPVPAHASEHLAAMISEVRPSVVHFHDLADPDLVSAARAEAPVLASVHGYAGCTPNTYYFRPGDECRRAHGPGCIANMTLRGCAHTHDPRGMVKRYRATTRRLEALRRVDQVVAYSAAMARHLRRNEIDRCVVVPLFARPQAALAPPPQHRRILFAGRVVAAKGLGVLLDAARGLDCAVDVYGDGWWLSQAQTQVARRGISDRVIFHGWTDEQTLARGYEDCRVAVVPSLWPEPFGLVGIEAMAHGRPVVASDTGGVREWLVDGKTGYLVAPGDSGALRRALSRLLDDHDLCAEMGLSGATRSAELFSPATHVAALTRVYNDAGVRWRQTARSELVEG